MLENRYQSLLDQLDDYIEGEAKELSKVYTKDYCQGYRDGLIKAFCMINKAGER